MKEGADMSKKQDPTGKYFSVEMNKLAAEKGQDTSTINTRSPGRPSTSRRRNCPTSSCSRRGNGLSAQAMYIDDINYEIWSRVLWTAAIALAFLLAHRRLCGRRDVPPGEPARRLERGDDLAGVRRKRGCAARDLEQGRSRRHGAGGPGLQAERGRARATGGGGASPIAARPKPSVKGPLRNGPRPPRNRPKSCAVWAAVSRILRAAI